MDVHPIPDAALDADIAILGKKGRGKTYTAKGIVERLLGMGRKVVVLDPLSVWWGLRSSADGKGEGFPIAVFGGPHADMPLGEEIGRPLARIVASENFSVVLDMGEMRKAAWQRLVADFFDELFATNRDPLWIVLEEADVFAPQQPREGDSVRVLGEVDRVARRGRAYGFRLISITQRPARLHKDVLTQLSTLVALGLTSPQDRDAIKAWVEGNADRDQSKAVMDSLARLPVGEGWIWAPDHELLERVRFPQIATLDTSATPKAGEKRIEPKRLSEVDLTEIRKTLAGTVESNETKAPAGVTAEQLRVEYERGWADGDSHGYDRGRKAGKEVGILGGVAIGLAKGQEALDALRIAAGRDFDAADAQSERPAKEVQPLKRSVAHRPNSQVMPSIGLNSAARKMLAVLDTNPPVRRTWTQTATLAGLRARGGHFNAGRKALLEGGLVVEDGNLIRIAEPSASAAPPADDPAARVEQWERLLSGAAPRILRCLFDRRGSGTREQVAQELALAPRGGHWNAAWKELRDNDIVVEQGGVFRLTELFRPS